MRAVTELEKVAGYETVAIMPGEIDELRTRKGKLMARIGEIWHIVPLKRHKQNG